MTPEHTAANLQSWVKLREFIERFDGNQQWQKDWLHMARRCLQIGTERGFDRYFHAGQSMTTFIFSPVDYQWGDGKPWVTVSLFLPDTVKLTYKPATPAAMGDKPLEYDLGFEQGMATMQRFMIHLWEMTMPEPVPEELLPPGHPFVAPVLIPSEGRDDRGRRRRWWQWWRGN